MPRIQGSKGFTNSEIRLVLKEILELLPRSSDDWKKVYENCKNEVNNFNCRHPDRPLSIRKQETLRRKYSDMIAFSKKKDNNLIGDKEYIRLCQIANSIHTLCVIRSPDKSNSAITEAEIKKKQQEIMISLQYENTYSQPNGFAATLNDTFGFDDDQKLNLLQMSQHRQLIQQLQRPIQPKLENSGQKIIQGNKVIDTGSYSSESGKSSPLISGAIDQNGAAMDPNGDMGLYQNKKRGNESQPLSPYQMGKRLKYGSTEDSLSMLMQTAINQNSIPHNGINQEIEFIDNENMRIKDQLRYVIGVLESLHKKVQNIESQMFKLDVITNHLEVLESKIYLMSNSKMGSSDLKSLEEKKKKEIKAINETSILNGNTSSTSKSISITKNSLLNKILPNSVSKLVTNNLDSMNQVNNIKNPVLLSPKSRGRVQFFETTFGLKLNLDGKIDPDFNSPAPKVSDIILLPETMENIRHFRTDFGEYLTPKSLERIDEFEAQYAKNNANTLTTATTTTSTTATPTQTSITNATSSPTTTATSTLNKPTNATTITATTTTLPQSNSTASETAPTSMVNANTTTPTPQLPSQTPTTTTTPSLISNSMLPNTDNTNTNTTTMTTTMTSANLPTLSQDNPFMKPTSDEKSRQIKMELSKNQTTTAITTTTTSDEKENVNALNENTEKPDELKLKAETTATLLNTTNKNVTMANPTSTTINATGLPLLDTNANPNVHITTLATPLHAPTPASTPIMTTNINGHTTLSTQDMTLHATDFSNANVIPSLFSNTTLSTSFTNNTTAIKKQ